MESVKSAQWIDAPNEPGWWWVHRYDDGDLYCFEISDLSTLIGDEAEIGRWCKAEVPTVEESE